MSTSLLSAGSASDPAPVKHQRLNAATLDFSDASGAAIALGGMISLAVAMGIGRFAFTPLLPMMLNDGVINLVQGGWLATLNYVGYFVGAALCAVMRPDPARAVRLSLVATVLLTLGMAIPAGAPLWSLWRAAAGVASAVAMVCTASWCLQRLTEMGKPQLGGLIFCGPGIGIMVTGLSAFVMVDARWPSTWAWATCGVLALLLVISVYGVFRPQRESATRRALGDTPHRALCLTAEGFILIVGYGLAGFGYIITATFLPVIARQAVPGTVWADWFWPIFGAGVALGAWAATRVGVQHNNRHLLSCAYLMQAAGVAIAVMWPTVGGFAISSLLVGLPFTALVAFAMREAQKLWGGNASRLMALMTASYGLGQIAGPPLATVLVTRTGGFTPSLMCAAGALVLGSVMFGWPRRAAARASADPSADRVRAE